MNEHTDAVSKDAVDWQVGKIGKLLILNESWDTRNQLAETIQTLGLECHTPKPSELVYSDLDNWSPWLVIVAEFVLNSEVGRKLMQWRNSDAGRPCHLICLLDNLDEATIAQCLKYGCNDVLRRDYTLPLLQMKLQSAARAHRLYLDLQRNHQQQVILSEQLYQDMKTARRIFDRLTEHTSRDGINYKSLRYSLEMLNGDMILAQVKPSGVQHFLVGDMTGHGLPAAIEAMMVHDIFNAMTLKGFELIDIARELNRKLEDLCPTGRFLSCALLELNPFNQELTVINAGLPDILIMKQNEQLERVASDNLPFGITTDIEFMETRQRLSTGDLIYAFSDGLIEMENDQGIGIGQEAIELLLLDDCTPQGHRYQLNQIIKAHHQRDDISVLQIVCLSQAYMTSPASQEGHQKGRQPLSRAPMGWDFQLELDTEALRYSNPVPILMHFVLELQGLHAHQESLFMLLTEMFSNALEHGILKLSSDLKHSPEGFAEYYQQRTERLKTMQQGLIHIGIRHHLIDENRYLDIRMKDSGAGYDVASVMASTQGDNKLCGRGLKLIHELSESVAINETGNSIEVRYLIT